MATIYDYEKVNYVNKTDGLSTPVNKTNLNHTDQGVYDNRNYIKSMAAELATVSRIADELVDVKSDTETYRDQAHTYEMQTEEYYSQASASASSASASATSAADSAAKAFSGTPEGYAALVSNVFALNNDLTQLSYSNVAGGKNLLDADGTHTVTSAGNIIPFTKCHIESGKTYTLSLKSSDLKTFDVVTPDAKFIKSGAFSSNTTTFVAQNSAEEVRFYASGACTIYDVMIEENSQATTYEPYIMSNKQLTNLNESLNEQGLVSVFDGKLKNGYYNYNSDGSFVSDINVVCSENGFSCKVGDTVKLVYGEEVRAMRIYYYNGSTFVSSVSTTSDAIVIVPSGVNTVKFSISKTGITKDNALKIWLYVGNAIDASNRSFVLPTAYDSYTHLRNDDSIKLNIPLIMAEIINNIYSLGIKFNKIYTFNSIATNPIYGQIVIKKLSNSYELHYSITGAYSGIIFGYYNNTESTHEYKKSTYTTISS